MQEFHAALLQFRHGLDDVVRRHGDMLYPFAVVKLEVFFYLRFLFAFGRLIDRKLHEPVPVAHHLAHQRRVFSGNIFVIEAQDVSEAHHLLIKFHPRIHLVPANIAHAMIDMLQSGLAGIVVGFPSPKPWHKRAMIILPFNEKMNNLAVGINAAHD